jgi:hypothetical protein
VLNEAEFADFRYSFGVMERSGSFLSSTLIKYVVRFLDPHQGRVAKETRILGKPAVYSERMPLCRRLHP